MLTFCYKIDYLTVSLITYGLDIKGITLHSTKQSHYFEDFLILNSLYGFLFDQIDAFKSYF